MHDNQEGNTIQLLRNDRAIAMHLLNRAYWQLVGEPNSDAINDAVRRRVIDDIEKTYPGMKSKSTLYAREFKR